MSKTCPNCGVNSPDNAKFCIECAHSLEGVPINKEEKTEEKSKNDTQGNTVTGCIILIAIVAIVIVAVGFLFLGWGGNSNTEPISISFDEVYASDFTNDEGKICYDYFVKGYINNFPDDTQNYLLKTIYYDSQGHELTSTTEKLSYFDSYKKSNYAATLSFYQTKNYIDVDHVSVQIIKDNQVVGEFNSTMNKNKLTTIGNTNNTTR